MDNILIDHAADEAAKTEMMINQCSEYLFSRFNWKARIGEVTEVLNQETPSRLNKALACFMCEDRLTLRLLLDDTAMTLCERSALMLVRAYGEDWLMHLEGVDYE